MQPGRRARRDPRHRRAARRQGRPRPGSPQLPRAAGNRPQDRREAGDGVSRLCRRHQHDRGGGRNRRQIRPSRRHHRPRPVPHLPRRRIVRVADEVAGRADRHLPLQRRADQSAARRAARQGPRHARPTATSTCGAWCDCSSRSATTAGCRWSCSAKTCGPRTRGRRPARTRGDAGRRRNRLNGPREAERLKISTLDRHSQPARITDASPKPGDADCCSPIGAVAQLVSAPDCRSGGCGFESRRPRSEIAANHRVCGYFRFRVGVRSDLIWGQFGDITRVVLQSVATIEGL